MKDRLSDLLKELNFSFPEMSANTLIEEGVIFPPVKIGTLVWGVFGEKPYANAKTYYRIEACRVNEIMYFPNGNFLFGVREVNRGVGHNMRFEEMYFEFEDAEKAFAERSENAD